MPIKLALQGLELRFNLTIAIVITFYALKRYLFMPIKLALQGFELRFNLTCDTGCP